MKIKIEPMKHNIIINKWDDSEAIESNICLLFLKKDLLLTFLSNFTLNFFKSWNFDLNIRIAYFLDSSLFANNHTKERQPKQRSECKHQSNR